MRTGRRSGAWVVSRWLGTRQRGAYENVAHVARLLVLVWNGARRVQMPRMAAALSFRTIFGLLPMVMVALIVIKNFWTPEQMEQGVRQVLGYTGLAEIVVDRSALAAEEPTLVARGATEASASDLAEELKDRSFLDLAGTSEALRLDKWIQEMVGRLNAIRLGAISFVSALILVYAAISMIVEVEKAFNQIYAAPRSRSWPRRVAQYWTLLTLGAFGLAGSYTVQQSLPAAIGGLAVPKFAMTVMISTGVMLLLYMTVPNTRVHFRPALAGALLAGLAWEAGKWGFGAYVSFSGGQARLYGILALFPMFLMWIYVTWLIVLMGLQVAQAIQAYNKARRDGLTPSILAALGFGEAEGRSRTPFVDPGAVLSLGALVARRFAKGETTEPSDAASAIGVEDDVASEMLSRLARAGLVHRIDGDGGYTLARPGEGIAATEVLGVGEAMASEGGAGKLLLPSALGQARQNALAGQSLARVAEDLFAGGDQARASGEAARA